MEISIHVIHNNYNVVNTYLRLNNVCEHVLMTNCENKLVFDIRNVNQIQTHRFQ